MNLINILQKPIITEKTYKLMEMNKYVFIIHPKARKDQVKNAFSKIFGVEVLSVNLSRRKPKKKRVGRFLGKTTAVKKAIITLKPGQQLNILQNEEKGAVDKNQSSSSGVSVFDKFKKLFFNSNPKVAKKENNNQGSKMNIQNSKDISDAKEKK